ncbi:hypothetical protein G6514_003286 [Epicoccum nigrum]|nr:hypothetical protein G6514_003286 [Epicoccum nigrum]
MREQKSQFRAEDIQDLTGYVVIVTGGNSGIGYETALNLALHNARVYIASRSAERISSAIYQMKESAPNKNLDLRILQLDMMDLASVKAAATRFVSEETRLDILINNAGIMGTPFETTKDGYESQWQVNYLAPFVLTHNLLPLMLRTASETPEKTRVRVINLATEMTAMLGPKTISLKDVDLKDACGPTAALQRYSHSKQGSIRHAKELNDRYSAQGLTAYSLHPGLIKTNLQGKDPSLFGRVQGLVTKVIPKVSAHEGALNSLYCATSPKVVQEGAGRYFIPVGKLQPRVDGWLADKDGNAELWKWSENVNQQIK